MALLCSSLAMLLHSKETNLSLIPNFLIQIDLNLVFLSCSLPRDILLGASFKSFDFFMFWSFIFYCLYSLLFFEEYFYRLLYSDFFFFTLLQMSLLCILFCFVYRTSQHLESNQGANTQPLHWKCSLNHWTARSFNLQVF